MIETEAYLYNAFGLTISSCIHCPELIPGSGVPDVFILYGPIPDVLPGARVKTGVYQAASGRFLLALEGIAKFLICDGRKIIIEKAKNAQEDRIRAFLLGSVFGALLHQLGILTFHASSIKSERGCAVFSGPSGFGKSVIAAAFVNRGYQFLSDDVCSISMMNRQHPMVLPGYPQLKLWPDAVKTFGRDPESLERVWSDLEKHRISIRESFCHDPLPLSRLYVLEISDRQDFELRSLEGIEKFTALINCTYRREFLAGLGMKETHFSHCSSFAKHIPVYRLTRPKKPWLLDEVVDFLIMDFKG